MTTPLQLRHERIKAEIMLMSADEIRALLASRPRMVVENPVWYGILRARLHELT